jgi:putative CocE/NonD family hydrolase
MLEGEGGGESSMWDVALESDIMVLMRDGVCLATDVYLPAREGRPLPGPFPVILERTPYDKTAPSRSERDAVNEVPLARAEVATYFVRHGYGVVYQDCRGRYRSGGGFTKYLSEGEDGYDTLSWLMRQPWCNGRIGTKGLSYAAHTQGALACLNPPGLACMFIDSGGFSNAYQSGIRQGGAFELKQLTWAYRNALQSPLAKADPVVRAALESEDILEWFRRMPWLPGHSPLQWAREYEDYLFEQWTHGTFDDYWRQLGFYTEGFYDVYADVPMIHMSSWYDPYPRAVTENYLGLAKRKQGPVRLILGPWTHGNRSITYAGDVDFGPEATLDGNLAENYLALRLRWFDRWLKGVMNGVDTEPSVRVFIMGGGTGRRNGEGRLEHGGRWIEASGWPLPGTRYTPFYLHHDGCLSPELPAQDASPLSYNYDPRNPAPTIGGALVSHTIPVMDAGAFDQREAPRFFACRPPYLPLASRSDVLVFQTEPLEHDMMVVGPVTVNLWVSSTCPDTDFTAKLIDCHPPNEDYPKGFAMNMTDGILRARYRRSWEQPEMMTPGEVCEIVIQPFPTGNLFKAGHRIRLDISSSNFPRFDVNPNTGGPEGLSRQVRIAINSIYVDRLRPSNVVLPVIHQ